MGRLFFGFFALIATTQVVSAQQGIFPTNEICGRLEELGLSHETCEDPMAGVLPTPPAAPPAVAVEHPKRVAKRKKCCDPNGKPCTQTGPCVSSR